MSAVVARRGSRAARSSMPAPVRALTTSTGVPSSARQPRGLPVRVDDEVGLREQDARGDAAVAHERDEALEPAEVQVAVGRRDDEAEVDVRGHDLDAGTVGPAQDAEARQHLADRAARLDADPVADDRRIALVQQGAGDRRLTGPLGTAHGDTPAVDGGDASGFQARGQLVGHALGPSEGE